MKPYIITFIIWNFNRLQGSCNLSFMWSLASRANRRKRDSCGARLDVDRRNKAGHLWLPLFLEWLLGVNGRIGLIREPCKNSHHLGTELVRTLNP
jgi:hypothetical protein